MHYMAPDMQPLVRAGLSDLPLVLILAGVLLCAGIVATTLSLIRRSRGRIGSATAGLSPTTIALKIAVVIALLLAAAAFFVNDSGGLNEAIARIKGEPCCPENNKQPCCTDGSGQPCCPELQGEKSASETDNSNAAVGDTTVDGQSGEDAIQ